MTTYVYLAHNATGDLLYVGHTGNVETRIALHASNSDWPAEVARIDVHEFANYDEALAVERDFIADLEPLHNLLGNPRFHPEPYEFARQETAA